jgi:hypothetical protein
MSSPQGQRIQAYCEIIWGEGEYDINVETDDWVKLMGVVKKDFGSYFGPPLTITGICNSVEHAWNELDRMLDAWASQIQTGQPMTRGQKLDSVDQFAKSRSSIGSAKVRERAFRIQGCAYCF